MRCHTMLIMSFVGHGSRSSGKRRRTGVSPSRQPLATSEPTASRRGSLSQAKNTSSLQFANIRIRGLDYTPPTIQTLVDNLVSISDKINVIPQVLEEKASKCAKPHRIYKHNLLSPYPMSDNKACEELLELRTIVRDAACCDFECEEEAAWNAKVHSPLLKIALQNSSATATVKH